MKAGAAGRGLAGPRIVRSWLGACALGASLSSCASFTAAQVVEPREISDASGSPKIRSVEDLGGVDIPSDGTLRTRSGDGVAVIGEVLWIHGDNFGRQPTVSIGGHVAAVVSRTGDEGILCRVPVGTPAGPQPLVVTQEDGQGSLTIKVRRIGALLAGDRVAWFAAGPDGPTALPSTPLPAPRFLQVSADARAAYVMDAHAGLHVFELPAPGGPTETTTVDLAGSGVRGLLGATTSHRLVVLRESDLLVLDTSAPLRPVRDSRRRLPTWLQGTRVPHAALSPDGLWLAATRAEGNKVMVVALDALVEETGEGGPSKANQKSNEAPAEKDPPAAELALVPETPAPVLADLTYSPDGQTLWVVSGLTDESKALGPQPTIVHALHVGTDGVTATLTRARSVEVPAATSPLSLSTGRSLALASGSAIRVPPEKATVYLSARARADGRPTIYAVGAGDEATPLLLQPASARVGRSDVTPDGRWLLGVVVDSSGAVRVAAGPADGRPGAVSGFDVGAAVGATGAAFADLRIQP